MAKAKLFKNHTKQQKIAMFLKAKGYKEIDSRTGKYLCFELNSSYYFIGKSGALRISSKPAVTGSTSITGIKCGFWNTFERWCKEQEQSES